MLIYDVVYSNMSPELPNELFTYSRDVPMSSLLYSPNRNREGALGRAVVAYLGRKWAGFSFRAAAEHFRRDPVVISGVIRRLEQRIERDRDYCRRVEILEKNLIRNKKMTKVNYLNPAITILGSDPMPLT